MLVLFCPRWRLVFFFKQKTAYELRISDESSDVCSSDLHGVGFVLESASWRASPDWAAPLGLSLSELDALNVASVDLLHELRDEFAPLGSPILASGCMGPRGEGYDPGRIMSHAEARSEERREGKECGSTS